MDYKKILAGVLGSAAIGAGVGGKKGLEKGLELGLKMGFVAGLLIGSAGTTISAVGKNKLKEKFNQT